MGHNKFDAGFDLAKAKKRRRAALRWISRLHVITLFTGIEIARESYPKPRERPFIFIMSSSGRQLAV